MAQHSTDRAARPGSARKPWQTPKLTLLAAEDAENAPGPSVTDGPFSSGS